MARSSAAAVSTSPRKPPGSSAPPPSGVRTAYWRDIAVLIDWGTAVPEEYRRVEQGMCQLARQFGKLGCIVVIPSNARPPPEATKREINEVLSRLESRLGGLSWAVEASGFRGAFVRGVLTGVQLFRRRTYPLHVASSVGEAVGWTMERLGHAVEPNVLADAVSIIQNTQLGLDGELVLRS